MISRRFARALAELLELTFRKSKSINGNRYYEPDNNALYDFFFDHGYEAWFCNAAKAIPGSYSTAATKDFFMKLHTGETLVPATKNWTWEQREVLGQRYLTDIAEDVLQHWRNGPGQYQGHIAEPLAQLKRTLELDGYKWDGTRLVPNEADVLDTKEEAGVIRSLYDELSLADAVTTFHHLALTEEHYVAGRWDDSISNSRKFLESVLAQVAARHATVKATPLPPETLSRPVKVRDYLEREGLLEEKEKQAVASVYGLLSETGSHPYVAQHEQARLLRHVALTFAQFVMLRLRAASSAA